MQSLILLSVFIGMSAANIFDQYLMNMAMNSMDPFTRSFFQSSLGAELLDLDVGSSRGRGGSGAYGMAPSASLGPSPFANMVGNFPLPSYTSSNNNQVSQSSVNPSKSNSLLSALGNPGAPSGPGGNTLMSGQAVPARASQAAMFTQPAGANSNFLQNFWALGALDFFDFF